MEFEQKELDNIQQLSAMFFSLSETALIMEVEENDIRNSSIAMQHYNRGRLLSETELRKSIMELAKNGSSPAQSQALALLQNQKLKDAQ